MADSGIVITGVTLSPNPVQTQEIYSISVTISPVIFVLGDDTAVLADEDGTLIEVD